jgi:DNA polymerase-3 subunit gamma/tau
VVGSGVGWSAGSGRAPGGFPPRSGSPAGSGSGSVVWPGRRSGRWSTGWRRDGSSPTGPAGLVGGPVGPVGRPGAPGRGRGDGRRPGRAGAGSGASRRCHARHAPATSCRARPDRPVAGAVRGRTAAPWPWPGAPARPPGAGGTCRAPGGGDFRGSTSPSHSPAARAPRRTCPAAPPDRGGSPSDRAPPEPAAPVGRPGWGRRGPSTRTGRPLTIRHRPRTRRRATAPAAPAAAVPPVATASPTSPARCATVAPAITTALAAPSTTIPAGNAPGRACRPGRRVASSPYRVTTPTPLSAL